MRALALLVAVSACSPEFHASGSCSVQGWGAFLVEDKRPCGCLERLANEAVATSERVTGVHQDTSRVSVMLFARNDRLPVGRYDAQGDFVELERHGRSLAHELFHRAEVTALGATLEETARHEGWLARGWIREGDEFWYRWSPDTSTNVCW